MVEFAAPSAAILMVTNEAKKSAAVAIGQLLSVLLRPTAVSEAIIELGLWLALIFGADWWTTSHKTESLEFHQLTGDDLRIPDNLCAHRAACHRHREVHEPAV